VGGADFYMVGPVWLGGGHPAFSRKTSEISEISAEHDEIKGPSS
jgi:hypothetical protein